ncbi:NAD(P)-binding protein [Aulographum hederae CBS 113979]|uniref:NAD(P)-binding protein n=1 Tax=Aulographum hederae CBS 113979 TaxID=1176131 RepID=A0A6G1GNR8_9PEZI|nr:NAD(P)-binding protein [Aulographum hederae CBS 113979]
MAPAEPITIPYPTKASHHTTYPAISPTLPQHSVAGKAIFITGGGTGIGKTIATSFATAGAAHIAVTGRRLNLLQDVKKMVEEKYPETKVYPYSADMTDKKTLTAAMEEFTKEIRGAKIDILVANAALLPTPGPLAKVDVADWWAGFETNVLGSLNLLNAYVPFAAEGAKVLNVSSGAVHFDTPQVSSYNISKMAALRLFTYFAMENPGIDVMSFHPGILRTDMSDKAEANSDFRLPYDEIEIAGDFAVWLASEDAKFLKGKFVWSNWDIDDLKEMKEEIVSTPKFTLGLVGWP